MELRPSLIMVALLAATTNAQLLCFQCNDCIMHPVEVQPCGVNYETIAPPDGTTTVGPPISPDTTAVPPPDTTTTNPSETTMVVPETTTATTTVTPPDTTTVVPPETTTVISPETTTVAPPETTTVLPPVTTDPTTDGPPTPTLPTTVSTTVASTTNGLPTPPVTPMMATGQTDSRLVISLEPPPSPRYVCIAIKSIVANREVVRRGCAQLGHTVADTCNSASGGQHVSCSVCMSHLCNRG